MTNFFTKLASAFTLLALVASFVPAAAFAEEASVEATPEIVSDVVIETPSVEEAPSEESQEVASQETTPVVEEETGIFEEVINSVVSLFSAVDDISLDAVVVPETANVTIDHAVAIDGSWTTDRHEPETWGNNGTVFVDGTLAAQQQGGGTFYRTEGRKTSLNNVSSVEASLYIDPAWDNTAVRAGLWATGNGAVGEWGIIDYTTAASYVAGNSASFTKNPVFRTWNSTDGTWTPVMEAIPGQTYVLRVEVADGNWNYYINGDLLSQVPLDGTAGTTAIKEVILNHYNYGAEATPTDGSFGNRPYTVQWSDMSVTNSFDTLSAAVAAANAGETIEVNADVTETTSVIVDKAITIDGKGHTINLTYAGATAGITGGLGLSGNAVVKGLVVTGTVADNLIEVTGPATLTSVSVINGPKAGINVLDNGQLTITDSITLSGNKWGGIEVKKVSTTNVTFAAGTDLIYGISNDPAFASAPAVWVDAIVALTDAPFVTDAANVLADPVLVGAQTFWNIASAAPTSNGGGGRSSGSSRSTTTNTGTDTGTAGAVDGGQVLGASTYNFSANLTVGSTGADVNALQEMLIASGDLAIAAPTGYFGDLTKVALIKWQARHGVPATGFFGPLTMAAVVAAAPAPTMSAEARAALIKDLLEKVKEVQEKLDAMEKDAA